MARHRKPTTYGRQAQNITFALGGVILVALLIGSFKPEFEDLAFGVFLAASLVSIGLIALLRGERVRARTARAGGQR